MKRKIAPIAFLLAMLLAGCAVTGQPFNNTSPPKDGMASVYVYRPFSHVGSVSCTNVAINGGKSVPLTGDAILRFDVPPGRLSIKTEKSWCYAFALAFETNVESGSTVFVRYTLASSPFPGADRAYVADSPWFGFKEIAKGTAMTEMTGLRLAN